MLNAEEALAIVMQAFELGMIQAGYEARDFAIYISSRNICNILELGTSAGGMMYLMDRSCNSGLRISMDMPWDKRDPPMPEGQQAKFKRQLPHVIEIAGNIHHEAQREKLVDILKGRRLDLIFADADHSYGGAKKHFEMYSPFLNHGGYFAMHDIANGHPCQEYWEKEIAREYITATFAEPANRFGIGIVEIP